MCHYVCNNTLCLSFVAKESSCFADSFVEHYSFCMHNHPIMSSFCAQQNGKALMYCLLHSLDSIYLHLFDPYLLMLVPEQFFWGH